MTTINRYNDAVARYQADSTDDRAKMEIFITSGDMLDRGGMWTLTPRGKEE